MKPNSVLKKAASFYEETRTPLEKHANEMGALHDYEIRGNQPDVFARRKQQLDLDYEKASTFDQTPSRCQANTVVWRFADLQSNADSILGSDPATGKKQDVMNTHLQNIDDNIKAAAPRSHVCMIDQALMPNHNRPR